MKKPYSWTKVTAGDIISFRYKGDNERPGSLHSVLVLNPKLPHKRKDGSRTFHLVGLKLETFGRIPTIRSKPKLVDILETIGDIEVVSGEDEIYRVRIMGVGMRGARKIVYNRIKKEIKRYSVYRTYHYETARKSPVFLEPIKLPSDLDLIPSFDYTKLKVNLRG
tara:strand:+ start:1164 stop:1658 length:495 start_codon:yes stop_codon:yes gene_type:complete